MTGCWPRSTAGSRPRRPPAPSGSTVASSSSRARSVPRQEPPYRPLTEVVADQHVFELTDAGRHDARLPLPRRTPRESRSAGWHLHFISEDRRAAATCSTLAPRRRARPARPIRRAARRAAAGDRPRRSPTHAGSTHDAIDRVEHSGIEGKNPDRCAAGERRSGFGSRSTRPSGGPPGSPRTPAGGPSSRSPTGSGSQSSTSTWARRSIWARGRATSRGTAEPAGQAGAQTLISSALPRTGIEST